MVFSHVARWHVRDAELYIKAYANIKLSLHEAHFVEKYFESKGRNTRLEGWQFIQLITSIKILFANMVQVCWAENFPWDDQLEKAKGYKSRSRLIFYLIRSQRT